MTETTDDYVNRLRTANDEKLRILDLSEQALVPPLAGIFDVPTRCYIVNKEWAKIIMGAVSANLLGIAAWRDATDEGYSGIQAVEEFLRGDEDCCGECTIEVLLADDEFFQDEYLPQTFGDKYSGTAAKETELSTAYNGTPQSIGGLIPTGAPNPTQKNALCYAITKFVRLYCTQKVCTIQAKNFLEIGWNQFQEMVNDVYNVLVDWMIVYTPNIFSCFVDDSEALTVLPDESAQETLGCFLYGELDGVVMSKTAFDAALLAAAMSLSGNAQKIACIMNQDNNTLLYLHFLEIYNVALQRNQSELLDCPCESGIYRIWKWDFRVQGVGEFTNTITSPSQGVFVAGEGWKGTGAGNKIATIVMPLSPTWVIRAYGFDWRSDSGVVGSRTLRLRPQAETTLGEQIANLSTGADYKASNCALTGATNVAQLAISVNSGTTLNNVWIERVFLVFNENAAKGGYLSNDRAIC